MFSIFLYKKIWLILLSLLITIALSGCVTHVVQTPDDYSLEATNTTPEGRHKASEIHTQLGQVYFLHQRYSDSLENLLQAIKLNPQNVQAHTLLGILYYRMGRVDMAEKNYRKAQQINPNSGETNNNLGAFLCKIDKAEQSVPYLRKAINNPLYHTPWVAMTNMGVCQMKLNHFVQAKYYFTKALNIKPKYEDALFYMAKVLHKQKDDLHAKAFIQRYHDYGYHSQAMSDLVNQVMH